MEKLPKLISMSYEEAISEALEGIEKEEYELIHDGEFAITYDEAQELNTEMRYHYIKVEDIDDNRFIVTVDETFYEDEENLESVKEEHKMVKDWLESTLENGFFTLKQ